MDERLKKLIEEAVERNPELTEKYGNPLDENDPRNWTPSQRAEKGVSLEKQVELLGLDMEAQTMATGTLIRKILDLEFQLDKLQQWAAQKMADEFLTLVKENPEKAAEYLKSMLANGAPPPSPDGTSRGQWGPLEDDPNASIRYAGSSRGIAPDQLVETPEGLIRGDQIPGYVNDPNWRPSPDWMQANCMCPAHVAEREREKDRNPFDDGDSGTGMYL